MVEISVYLAFRGSHYQCLLGASERSELTIVTSLILLASERSERDTLRSVQLRIADIYYVLYIIYSTCKFVLITRKEGGA